MKERNVSIDILKCLAAILITNSHMGLLYGKYSVLATGGAIGDVLFFFCSGFTLFLGRMGRFDNWYKRRINRIYPTVFACAILTSFTLCNEDDMKSIILYGGGWFVSCIMIYYIVLYFVRRYFIDHLKGLSVGILLACAAWMFLVDLPSDFNMYGNTFFKWFHYFLFMLMGAAMGMQQKSYNYVFGTDLAKLLLSVFAFYGLCFFRDMPEYNKLHFFTIIPLLSTTFYFYKLCNSRLMIRWYNNRYVGGLIRFVGGLCLEIYLIQSYLFTDKMNGIFPLNIPVMFVIIVLAAYILRCFSRIFAQTFKSEDYDWRAVFKPF